MRPRVCIGMPLHNEEKYAAAAIESFLAQTYGDLTLSILDDASTDGTTDIVADLARRDRRIVVTRSETRGGAIHAFRRVHFAGGESDYFSWAGGHDLWHPRWLETLLGVMEQDRAIVLAYPLTGMITAGGEPMDVPPPRFETYGLSPSARARHVALRMTGAGNMLTGLFRTRALHAAGLYRRFLVPDVLLMTELAMLGPFRQVPEVLYYRRNVGGFSVRNPRTTLFSDENPMPWYGNLPFWIPNPLFVAWRATFARPAGADMTVPAGLQLAALQFARGAGGWVKERLRSRNHVS